MNTNISTIYDVHPLALTSVELLLTLSLLCLIVGFLLVQKRALLSFLSGFDARKSARRAATEV